MISPKAPVCSAFTLALALGGCTKTDDQYNPTPASSPTLPPIPIVTLSEDPSASNEGLETPTTNRSSRVGPRKSTFDYGGGLAVFLPVIPIHLPMEINLPDVFELHRNARTRFGLVIDEIDRVTTEEHSHATVRQLVVFLSRSRVALSASECSPYFVGKVRFDEDASISTTNFDATEVMFNLHREKKSFEDPLVVTFVAQFGGSDYLFPEDLGAHIKVGSARMELTSIPNPQPGRIPQLLRRP